MRPLVRRQQPTSFIRKWPRDRRAHKGPQEYVEEIHMEGAPDVMTAKAEILALAKSKVRKGWGMEFVAPPKLHSIWSDMLMQTSIGVSLKVRYFKEGACPK